uniref:Uncharacterized protein n=1 Tax=Oryza punctata TaxID=4537 RepID=A0A0E0K6R7_ORYPU
MSMRRRPLSPPPPSRYPPLPPSSSSLDWGEELSGGTRGCGRSSVAAKNSDGADASPLKLGGDVADLATAAEFDEFYANSVVAISEFGGNVYNAPLFAGEGLEEAYKFMADAISILFVSAMMGLQWHRGKIPWIVRSVEVKWGNSELSLDIQVQSS